MKHLIKFQRPIVKKRGVGLALSLLGVLLVSCKAPPYKFPVGEICIHNESNDAECTKEDLSYTRYELKNYICSNSDDYRIMSDYIYSIREKLITCEAVLKRRK